MKTKKILFPMPKRLRFEILIPEEVLQYRNINCIFYGYCLDVAARLVWTSFACPKNCKFHIDIKKDEMKEDINNYMKLLKEIQNG